MSPVQYTRLAPYSESKIMNVPNYILKAVLH